MWVSCILAVFFLSANLKKHPYVFFPYVNIERNWRLKLNEHLQQYCKLKVIKKHTHTQINKSFHFCFRKKGGCGKMEKLSKDALKGRKPEGRED